ncbi:hypothetical protein [Streptomyces sp. ME02-6979.5a]|uniref:hypothetical protein n=1 Tax=Streptomyces sp. ME02-6979.5a TaxID=462925 RepID=UPI0029C9ED6C|nr:hypothetical protein [Streptomyces sp. ME02-6979.5a]
MKSLPFTVVLVVSVVVVFVCAELLDFPWWLRLITVMGVVTVLEAANQAVGRACARRKAAPES